MIERIDYEKILKKQGYKKYSAGFKLKHNGISHWVVIRDCEFDFSGYKQGGSSLLEVISNQVYAIIKIPLVEEHELISFIDNLKKYRNE